MPQWNGPMRLHKPTQSEFARAVKAGQMLIIDGLSDTLSKGNEFTLDFLEKILGDLRVEVDRRAARDTPRDPSVWPEYQRIPFSTFRSMMVSEEFDGPRTYLQDDVNNLPPLRECFTDPPYVQESAVLRRKFWVSGRGLVSDLHYDPVEVLHWMMEGSKRFICYKPGLRGFYANAIHSKNPLGSRVDAADPDLAVHPRFRHATPIKFDLHAGELLYIPAFHWHHVESLSDLNVSINFIWLASLTTNLRNASQFAHAVPFSAWQARRIARARQATPISSLEES